MVTSILVKKEYSKPPNCHVYHIHLKKWKMSNTILVEDENCYSVTKHLPIINFSASALDSTNLHS